ncbi:hypothetical protein UR09_00345 [Candidatus Nitromaritima sp. SCGC AAA799-A02]|nr:hypothetical protein UR09_00345 [Candidatus Nitromaritima sp. SCGC AAA799-A02]
MEEKEQILALMKKLSFFSIFTDEEREGLVKLKNHIFSFRAGEYIIRQGEFDMSLFVIIKGKVYITKNERPKNKLAQLKAGEVFGEIAFLKKISRSANAIAETDTIAMKIGGQMFDKLDVEIQNKFRARFLDVLITRLDNMNLQYVRSQER